MTTARNEFSTSRARAAAFGLAAVVTLVLLAGMGRIADRQLDDVLLAQARSLPTQVVVVTGQRLPRV